MVRAVSLVFVVFIVFVQGFRAQASKGPLLPLVNGGESVSAQDPIGHSTVMLETEMQYCSAVIIAEDTLVTAAHCLPEDSPWIRIHFSGLEGKVSKEAQFFVKHENYQDLHETTRNDVALVFFKGGLPDPFKPVPLASETEVLQIGDSLTLAGYGGGSPLGSLAKINLQISGFLNHKGLIQLNQTSQRGICHGDSGGPAFRIHPDQISLIGVASYTQEVNCSGYSVYTNVIEQRDWISKTRKKYLRF